MKRVFLLATDYWLLPVIIRRLCLFILALLLPSAPAGAKDSPRVALRFVIRPQVVVAGVNFEIGADAGAEITEDELRTRVTLLEPGKRLSEQLLRENADALATYLRDRGFYRAEVTYSQQLDETR